MKEAGQSRWKKLFCKFVLTRHLQFLSLCTKLYDTVMQVNKSTSSCLDFLLQIMFCQWKRLLLFSSEFKEVYSSHWPLPVLNVEGQLKIWQIPASEYFCSWCWLLCEMSTFDKNFALYVKQVIGYFLVKFRNCRNCPSRARVILILNCSAHAITLTNICKGKSAIRQALWLRADISKLYVEPFKENAVEVIFNVP